MHQRIRTDSRFGFIDNVRGVAILLVILRHSFSTHWDLSRPLMVLAQFSQMGVQLFFVVSAFTLCLSMDKRRQSEGLTNYFIRRFFRIAPLFYFGILFYLFYHSVVVTALLGNPPEVPEQYSVSRVIANFLLIHDFYPAALRVVPGGWSIGTEATFYLIFPLLFWLYKRFRNNDKALIVIPVAALLISIATISGMALVAGRMSFDQEYRFFNQRNGFLYYNMICQLPVFLVGMSLYFKFIQSGSFSKWNKSFLAVGTTMTAIVAIIIYTLPGIHISFIPFSSAIFFMFLVVLFAEFPSMNNAVLARIGQLSYSMYLFHFIIVWNGIWYLPDLFPSLHPNYIVAINFTARVCLSYFIATISNKYIEKPGIRLGQLIIARISPRTTQPISNTMIQVDPKIEIIEKSKAHILP